MANILSGGLVPARRRRVCSKIGVWNDDFLNGNCISAIKISKFSACGGPISEALRAHILSCAIAFFPLRAARAYSFLHYSFFQNRARAYVWGRQLENQLRAPLEMLKIPKKIRAREVIF